ncbi:MAG: ArnT family glycosyltransferase [Chthoniobacterales bacterium]
MIAGTETNRRTFTPDKFQVWCGVILAVMALNLVTVTLRKSITTDEIVLIPSAYYHLVADELHLIGQHPPLCKWLAGLPLLLLQPEEWRPAKIDPAGPPDQDEWSYNMHFWRDNRPLFATICLLARLPMIVLTLALGVLVFVFARDLFGPRAGVFAVLLFAMEPTVLAHGRIVQTDIPAAFGLLLSIFALYRYIQRPSGRLAAGVGAAVAIAMLAKYSMLVVGPAFLLVLLALLWFHPQHRRKLALDGLIAAAVLLLLINAAYFFHHRALTEGDLKWIATTFSESAAAVTAAVRAMRLPLPTDFVMGVYWQLHHGKVGHPAGLLGTYSNHGWWYYFPVAFALKATIPFLILSLASLWWAARRVLVERERRWLWLLVPFAVYTGLLMKSPINIGVRYYLPGYMFLVILAGCLLDFLLQTATSGSRRRYCLVAVALTMSWISLEAIRAYPNYVPYLNQLAFAHPHWWYLSDSNVEWGDDARGLAEYLHGHGENRVRGLLLGAFATLDFYQINYVDALGASPEPPPRYTALGASFLNGSTVPPYEKDGKPVPDAVRIDSFQSYRDRKPEAIIGGSIYLYRERD